ncbi:YueH family protein [Niallia sp. 03133]|uniref:YueH family protein n=1 Tax=Niallia sp. 03133 TaxID=3458060 RepID=UPI0040446AAD
MISLLEDITQTGQKDTMLYIINMNGRFIIAIPKIHWSTEFSAADDLPKRYEHIHASLTFHMYDGDSSILANNITMHSAHYDDVYT